MSGPRITPRMAKLSAGTLVVVAVCVAAGIWQIARLHQVQQYNARVRAGLAAPPSAIEAVLPAAGHLDPDTVKYRRVQATGTYDAGREIVAYGRERRSLTGSDVLTPLLLLDGRAIVVDRGWMPLAETVPAAAAAPNGTVRVTGVLLASEGGDPGAPGPASAPSRAVAKIDLAAIQAELPYPIEPAYLLLQEQTPTAGAFLKPETLPPLSEGPHLSYSIQWFTFAAIAVIGFVVLVRREPRRTDEATGHADDEASSVKSGAG